MTVVELAAGELTARIDTDGARLHTLRHRGDDLVAPGLPFAGAVLAPWPNRVVDGRYRFAGQDRQLTVTEPDRGHALHGLVLDTEFEVSDASGTHVELEVAIEPQQGYPHELVVHVGYVLTEAGLTWTVTGTNSGTSDAPWGTAPHPYLVAGPAPVDDWHLALPATAVLDVTPDGLVPRELVPVDAIGMDFTDGRRIGTQQIDHAFTALAFEDGLTTAILSGPDRGVRMSWDSTSPWVQVHTADTSGRAALAIEPMTCAPDAYNSGLGLIVLAPGDSHSTSWTIAPI